MNKRRWFFVALWVAMITVAAVTVWQIQNESHSGGGQDGGAVEQVPTAPHSPTPTVDIAAEAAFTAQVLRIYEILHTEDQSKQLEMLPSVATERFINSSQWRMPYSNTTVTTTVDPTRSTVGFEESSTDKNVRFVTTIPYVIKVDTTSNERYEDRLSDDKTTWILEADGIWRVFGATQASNESNQL